MSYIPYAVQNIHAASLFYTQLFIPLNPLPLTGPSPLVFPLVTTSLFSTPLSLFLFCYIHLFSDPIYE